MRLAPICLMLTGWSLSCVHFDPPGLADILDANNDLDTNISPQCGDGVLQADMGETCDPGDPGAPAPVETAECDGDCTEVRCGDGYINLISGEECDADSNGDGNADNTVACDDDCTLVFCGDAHLNTIAGERCDAGLGNSDAPNASCRSNCLPRRCGDSIKDGGEQCDGGGDPDGDGTVLDTATCDSDCTSVSCGDSHLNMLAGERCDLGIQNSNSPNASCRTNCYPRRCGDGIKDSGEECDGGGPNDNDNIANDTSTCDRDCTNALCGDGYRNVVRGEQCDGGGNTAVCDGDCTFSACNDGFYNPVAESCDRTASGQTGCPAPFICNSTCTTCL